MTAPRYFRRKEISLLIGLSTDIVRRNEHALGIDGCKVAVNPRLVLYRGAETIAALQGVGLLPPPPGPTAKAPPVLPPPS